MTTIATPIAVWGDVQPEAVQQMEACVLHGDVAGAALMADHHLGYSQPIGGVIAYRSMISPSGVGFDIACGNKAVRTNLKLDDIERDLPRLADEIFARIAFGVGRQDGSFTDHEVFDHDRWTVRSEIASLKEMARLQLGTVGSGNHYVDVFTEPATGDVWVGVHFGSRGLGHKIATGYLKEAVGLGFFEKPVKGERYEREEPTLLPINGAGAEYLEAMRLAGDYAYAGRDMVVDTVLDILGADATMEVHNHHNFAWEEDHHRQHLYVIRKGATPLWPGQQSFLGGSMCDISVIVEGIASDEAERTFRSTVHGAGRVMGRMQAKGKRCKVCKGAGCAPGTTTGPQDAQPCEGSGWIRQPMVTAEQWHDAVRDYGIHLRGGGVDESPFVYRQLADVLAAHAESTRILHTLRPVIVCMAGAEVFDPYKD